MAQKILRGFFWSFLSAFLWGTTYLAGRALMRDGGEIDPVTLSLIRFSGAGALMLAVGGISGRKMFAFSRLDFLRMVCQGMIGMAGMSLFIFWGQQTTSAVNSSMIMTAVPVLILLGGLLTGEKITPGQWIGMAVATVGCGIVIGVVTPAGVRFDAFRPGDLLTFGAAVCWTVYTLWGRRTVPRVGGYVYTTWVMLGAVPLLALLALLRPGSAALPGALPGRLLVGYITVFPTAVAFFAWNEAQRLIGLPLLNIMQYLTPVTVLVLSWPLLGEGFSLFQLAGAVLVLLGVGLDPSFLPHRKRPPENEEHPA